ncbi:hypothetical protein HW555_002077, partial [Spodoptera exigua]
QWCGCEACGPGCGEAGAARDAAPGGDQLWRVALAECAGTALLCLAHVSGAQLNPTVTLAALVWGRMSRRRALCEALAQLAGAALGAAALRALLGGRVAGACATVPDIHIGPFQASGGAGGGAGRLPGAGQLRGGELTGASMNPARSFGPALWSSTWTSHWVILLSSIQPITENT